MLERVYAWPRSVRVAAVLMFAVPAVLWLFLVWDTRPYSPDEIAADRARIEALPAYERAVDECSSTSTWLLPSPFDGPSIAFPSPSTCRAQAFETYTSLTRTPAQLNEERGETGSWALLSMTAGALIIGVRWRPAPGARALIRRAVRVFLLGTLVALAVGTTWWWALDWIVGRRGDIDSTVPTQFISSGALLVGLVGALGLALGALLRGPLRLVATLSVLAVALGAAMLILNPIEPWLPLLNIEAFLFGDAEYPRAPHVVSCDHLYWPSIHGSPDPASVSDVCTSDSGTRSAGQAALYLFSSTGALTAAAALTNVRRRGARQPD